ncbi:MAG: hypothetical protein ACO3DJ_09215 [Alphaproteobacteria bacterium]
MRARVASARVGDGPPCSSGFQVASAPGTSPCRAMMRPRMSATRRRCGSVSGWRSARSRNCTAESFCPAATWASAMSSQTSGPTGGG